ncbi:tRNA lysidine(34) synthetase TilS [Thermosulfuriphilus sp.]
MDILAKIKGFIRKKKLLAPGQKILLAVSGGPDSMAMLDVFRRLEKPWNLKLGIAHFDHRLRKESREEAEFVKQSAEKYHLPFSLGAAPVSLYRKLKKLSLEEAARELRYRFLEQVAQRRGYELICLGHNLDDQAEEILIRLIRGAGRGGLAGIPAKRHPFIRPLLALSKAEILEYLKIRGINFREDPSNKSRLFLRNRIRLDLIPFLEKHFNPRIKETLWQTAEILSEEEAFFQQQIEYHLRRLLAKGNGDILLKKEVLELELALRRRLYLTIIRRLSPRAKVGFRHLEMLEDIIKSPSPGVGLRLGGLRIRRVQRGLLFSPSPLKAEQFRLLIPGPGRFDLKALGQILVLEEGPISSNQYEEGTIFLDAEKVSYPLVLRSPRPGDRFHPLGAPGRKNVFRFLADSGIDREERKRYPVLVSQDQILAVIPLRPADWAKVTSKTKKVIQIRLLPKDNNTY